MLIRHIWSHTSSQLFKFRFKLLLVYYNTFTTTESFSCVSHPDLLNAYQTKHSWNPNSSETPNSPNSPLILTQSNLEMVNLKKKRIKENSQLESFEELVVLRLGPALPRLGDGIRLPNLLAQILPRRDCLRRLRHRREGSNRGNNGHSVRIQERTVCWIRVSRDHDQKIERCVMRRKTAEIIIIIYSVCIYKNVCVCIGAFLCLTMKLLCDCRRSVALPNYNVPRVWEP